MKTKFFFILALSIGITACNNGKKKTTDDFPVEPAIPEIEYKQLSSLPHDTNSFTEGFLFHDGQLFESTGATKELSQTQSLFGIVNIKTGKIETKAALDRDKYFGEGIAFLDGKIFQLTYTTKVGFIYDQKSYKKIGEFQIPSKEGWGLTTDSVNLIMSDGTNLLTYLDPKTLQVVKKLNVTQSSYAKDFLNELEYINGFIYANIWGTNSIVKIDPVDGKIVGTFDLSILANDAKQKFAGALEMNGIAYNKQTDQIFITGKMWPKIYEISFKH